MDGTFVATALEHITLPVLVLIVGGIAWALVWHIKVCRKEQKEFREHVDYRLDKVSQQQAETNGYLKGLQQAPKQEAT